MKKGKESRPHIGIFGLRNNGKSSLINCLAAQDVAIVADVPGTTTDPVRKILEIGGLGPVVLIDTAGIDDTGDLGTQRILKTQQVLKTVDLALLVVTNNTIGKYEENLLDEFGKLEIPYIIVHNKSDIDPVEPAFITRCRQQSHVLCEISALKGSGRETLIDTLRKLLPESSWKPGTLIGDLISYGDTVLLITPIDIEAPEGRLILPQVQVIRDILDNDGIAVVCKEREVDVFIRKMNPKPALAITDSQVFPKADAAIPKDIPLTSFSIVLARQKGDFANYLKGTPKISELRDGDKVLVLESCSHHVSCDDIGRMKIPRWLSGFTGKSLHFDTVAGLDQVPVDIKQYALVVQCGGCMITRRQLINRLKPAVDAGIPVTNYGMAIAYVHGIYNRAVAPFLKMEGNSELYL